MSRADKLWLWAALGVFLLTGGIVNHMDRVDELRREEMAAIRQAEEAAQILQVHERYESYLRWEEMMAQRKAQVVTLEYVPPLAEIAESEPTTEEEMPSGNIQADVPLDYDLQGILRQACEDNGVPLDVGLGLIETESSFNTAALNKTSGCYGLCQLNPHFFPADLSPADNIRTGMAYLGEQIERYNGDMWAALTAYNAGYDWGGRDYANKVMAAAERWREG